MIHPEKASHQEKKESSSAVPATAEGKQNSLLRWLIYPLRNLVGNLFCRSKEGGATEISPQTIAVLKESAKVLPDGPEKILFAALHEAIGGMDDLARTLITEERVSGGAKILETNRMNTDLCLLVEGTAAILLHELDERILRTAPTPIGEISTMRSVPTTAAVEMVNAGLIVRIHKSSLEEIMKNFPLVREALTEIIRVRMERTIALASLKKKGLNPAQILAEMAKIPMEEPGTMGKEAVLRAVRQLVPESGGMFHIKDIPAGDPCVRRNEVLSGVRMILSGDANILVEGGKVGILQAGDFIGATDIFTPSRRSSFEISAIKPMQTVEIPLEVFLALRPQLEAILAKENERLLGQKRQTTSIESAPFSKVPREVIEKIHASAEDANQYVPLRPSGNELIFECGRADQVLCWLSVRGLLSHQGTTGWRLLGETPEHCFELQRAPDDPITVRGDMLINENLRPAIREGRLTDTLDALELYVKSGLSFEQARYLVMKGIFPRSTPNPGHVAVFRQSFPEIQEALSYVATWAEQPERGAQRRMLADMLGHLLIDTTQQIGITTLMKDPATRDVVLGCLKDMLALPDITEEEFRAEMRTGGEVLRSRFDDDNTRWNGVGTTRGTTAFRARLLAKNPVLYTLSSGALTPTQSQELQRYVRMLDAEVCPALVQELERLLGGSSPRPLITGRTKDTAGIIDKVRRVQAGNRGKEPRPDFCLADLPDAVGARVILRGTAELERAMAGIEETFGARIVEKDDFYGNPKKQEHPYRLVTYTVECRGVPAEIQLQTLPSAVASAFDHDILYKPYVPASLRERAFVSGLLRRVAATETRERLANGHAAPEREAAAVPKPPMRQLFQSVSPAGGCVCAYVSEDDPSWKDDLADARKYFQWHETAGERVTMHHGSSAITCSACIGMRTWKQFREATIAGIKRRPGVPPEMIDDLEKDGVPLFVLEVFADDLDFKGNETRFRALVCERYAPQECARIENALAIAKRAHEGQSYAIEKVDETGKLKYSSSLLLKHVPYVNHCVQTGLMMVECNASAAAVEAELLHDVVEDTTETIQTLWEKKVSPDALVRVHAVTKLPEEKREKYMERMRTLKDEPKMMKAIDRLHNLLRAFNLRDSSKYLQRIISESRDIFAGEFAPNAALANFSLRFHMLLEAVEQLLKRKYGGGKSGA